jgi:hypothetical protein
MAAREENERSKMGGYAPRRNDNVGTRGNARVVAVNNGTDDRYSRKANGAAGAAGVGARHVSDFDDTKDKTA